jgi:hypothetical protein
MNGFFRAVVLVALHVPPHHRSLPFNETDPPVTGPHRKHPSREGKKCSAVFSPDGHEKGCLRWGPVTALDRQVEQVKGDPGRFGFYVKTFLI